MMHEEENGERLVQLARDSIVHALGGPLASLPRGAWFEQPAATFVTVTRRGRLHGCIGSIWPRRALAEDVERNAVAAAFEDPRSMPFRVEHLPEMGVEVTLLSPLERVLVADEEDALRQIAPGIDGLVLRCGPYRGTFLPQVWDTIPDPREFLAELKAKAGLRRDYWDDEVELYRYRAQKWGDRRAALAGAAEAAS